MADCNGELRLNVWKQRQEFRSETPSCGDSGCDYLDRESQKTQLSLYSAAQPQSTQSISSNVAHHYEDGLAQPPPALKPHCQQMTAQAQGQPVIYTALDRPDEL